MWTLVQLPASDAVELEEDEFYDWELVDCRVETIDNQAIGHVREVLHTGAAPVLVVRDEAGVLGTATAVEGDAEDRRVQGARELLDSPERRQSDSRVPPLRARERVGRR